jgi:hypothetical protein
MSAPSRTRKQPCIFVSYSRRDSDLAREVAARLRDESFDIYLDVDEVEPGDNAALATGRALERSDAAVVLLSDDYMKSEWSRKEWDYLLGTKRFAGRVLPVLTPGTQEENLPWIWKKLSHVKPGLDGRLSMQRVARALKSLLGPE